MVGHDVTVLEVFWEEEPLLVHLVGEGEAGGGGVGGGPLPAGVDWFGLAFLGEGGGSDKESLEGAATNYAIDDSGFVSLAPEVYTNADIAAVHQVERATDFFEPTVGVGEEVGLGVVGVVGLAQVVHVDEAGVGKVVEDRAHGGVDAEDAGFFHLAEVEEEFDGVEDDEGIGVGGES